MKNLFFTILLMFVLRIDTIAQSFDSDRSVNSVVLVWVTDVNGTKQRNVLTGFVWKRPNQIVTALHGMRPGWKIEVKYAKQSTFREARITKVLPSADLVLLELVRNDQNFADVAPILNANTEKIAPGRQVHCIGFLEGSSGIPTRTLLTGSLHPKETLNFLLPDKTRRELMASSSLNLDLDILFFGTGNLLPSNSGAPIFDNQGRLVGIGNGGLEKGTINISWAIPAKYIAQLENSSITQLPSTTSGNRNLFSSTVITASDDLGADDFFQSSNQFVPVTTADFEFYLTKNRSINELEETAEDPNLISGLGSLVKKQYGIEMDLGNLRLDIYEDIQNGIVIVVPENMSLEVSDPGTDEEALEVTFEENESTVLTYLVMKNDPTDDFNSMATNELMVFLEENFLNELAEGFGISGFEIIQEFSYAADGYATGRRKFYIMAKGSEYVKSDEETQEIFSYVTLLINEENIIITAAITALSVDLIEASTANGLDCTGDNAAESDCYRMQDFYTAIVAAHLSTFAY